MRMLIALGGNALAADGSTSYADQIAAVRTAATDVVALRKAGHQVVLTHGNGPQVGDILVKNEIAASQVAPVPLDWCGANTQGSIGFILLNALQDAGDRAGVQIRPAAVVTRTLVSSDDPGFDAPTKPVGRHAPRAHAESMMRLGQTWQDRGKAGWRRVVPSPEPIEVLDAPAMSTLVDAGFLVVGSGGGGVPVVRDPDGTLRGVEAVIDKDLSAVVLAAQIQADTLVIATDVTNAVVGFGTPQAEPLGIVGVSKMRRLAGEGHFPDGSMGPKVDAACRFVEAGGARAVITSLDNIAEAVESGLGTVVVAD
jgi:carbamate kinase